MALTATAALLVDGDAAFTRVDNRRPAHTLAPGEVAAAANIRFEHGRPWPRLGVSIEAWGLPGRHDLIAAGSTYDVSGGNYVTEVTGFVVGHRYWLKIGNASRLFNGGIVPTETYTADAMFLASQTEYFIDYGGELPAAPGVPITAQILYSPAGLRTCAYGRFNNPADADIGILLTDDWRTNDSEDGGRGRAWRIQSNNIPLEIPLNGYDIWDTCRLTQCHNAMVMHRHGDTRHYWSSGLSGVTEGFDFANDQIDLHATPEFNNGDLVEFNMDLDFGTWVDGSAIPAHGASYYAKIVTGSTIELYTNANLTDGKLEWSSAYGRFWIRRVDTAPGFFGNDAANLILQGTDTLSAFDNGWRAVPASVQVTSTSATDDTLTAPNHRLQPGHRVALVTGTTFSGWTTDTKYARPLSEHVLEMYDTQDQALTLSSTTGRVNFTADGETGFIEKYLPSKLPMPSMRESVYYLGRLIGINGRDNILISDPYDFLHFSIFTGTVPANLGESGQANWLRVLGEDVLLVGRGQSVLALTGLTGSASDWRLVEITREYGGIAPLAALNVGADVQFLSRKGWASVVRTIAGEKLGQARTLSESIPNDLAAIDWINASQSCAAFWNNRLFISCPNRAQDEGELLNNLTLAHNNLNMGLQVQQTVVGNEVIGGVIETGNLRESWEGTWTGDWLNPVAYTELTVAGEEMLTFATPDGLVCYFHEGWDDVGATEISSTLTTRGYFGGKTVLCLGGSINFDQYNPSVTVRVQMPGYAESTTLLDAQTYDSESFVTFGQSGTDFSQPGRAGYVMNPDAGLWTEGVAADVHQNITEPLWMRERTHAPQLIIANTQGSLRLNNLQLNARPTGRLAITNV